MMILISGSKATIKTITTHHIPSQRRLLVWILIDIDSIWLYILSASLTTSTGTSFSIHSTRLIFWSSFYSGLYFELWFYEAIENEIHYTVQKFGSVSKKEVSYAQQSCISFITNTVKTVISCEIIIIQFLKIKIFKKK